MKTSMDYEMLEKIKTYLHQLVPDVITAAEVEQFDNIVTQVLREDDIQFDPPVFLGLYYRLTLEYMELSAVYGLVIERRDGRSFELIRKSFGNIADVAQMLMYIADHTVGWG